MISSQPGCRPYSEPYDRLELIADGALHVAGILFAITGTALLIWTASGLPALQNASVWVYGFALVTMFGVSAAYNVWPVSKAKLILRRFDHSAIFLFIAATYTPFIAQSSLSALSISLLVTIWTVAWIGVILKLGFPGRFERLSIGLCLALGWSGLVAYDSVFSPLPASIIALILAGGALYSIGVIFHLWDRLRFQNAIWHAFVLSAAALQFLAVFNAVSAAVATST